MTQSAFSTASVLARNFTVVTAAVLALGTGCIAQPDELDEHVSDTAMSFEEFEAQTFHESDSDTYIVDGDVPILGIKNLREFYERHVQNGALIVNTSGGLDTKWSDTQKLNLTYCVSSASFGTNYGMVVQAMKDAAKAWEYAANVNFIHASGYDGNCSSSTTGVVFDVRQGYLGNGTLARAFVPNFMRASRNIIIDPRAYIVYGSGGPTLTGTLRHELGHALGFRHEHTRNDWNPCYEDNNWRALTTHDSYSVMHYPDCNGSGVWSFNLTALDGAGAAALYGAPGGAPSLPPSGTVTTATVSGSVATNASANHGPYAVVAGSTFKAVMSGTGDPDLYVGFGTAPTLTAYNCRPYLSGASETCEIVVPTGQTSAYIMVNGFKAATYNIALTYTKP